MYAEPGNPRCPALSFKKYLARRPPGVTAFYLHPLNDPKPHLWYSTQPMGKNYLGDMLPRLSKAAGMTTRYTNHSLRSTAVRRLSEAGLESRQIMSVITGHRCESSLKSYWAPSNTDKKVWSRVLSAPQQASSAAAFLPLKLRNPLSLTQTELS
ncbi:hypothetical protein PFLUV_G00116190 [Perca fluviatilis]|uniref:ZMYM2-like/QRICH1 C-terminal domain-containing protein n=1 Tax=Perca fluviatilis TaxID=8168 RepID=A0A6A5EVX3_PERFL|nr:hypothetical protein PFLUV_G00116190 [Perca fluviatilis]